MIVLFVPVRKNEAAAWRLCSHLTQGVDPHSFSSVRPHRLDADDEELIAPAATADDLDTCICAVAGYSRHRAIVNIGAADI